MKNAEETDNAVSVNLFVGSPENCSLLDNVAQAIGYYQNSVDDPIQAWVIPLPEDQSHAEFVRRATIHNINEMFRQFTAEPEEMN